MRASGDHQTARHVEIPVGAELKAVVDEADAPLLLSFRWRQHTHPGVSDTIYASTRVPNTPRGRTVYMHRMIMQPPAGMVVHHVNGNGLDNRRSNLQICTHKENLSVLRKPSMKSDAKYNAAEQKSTGGEK